MEIKKSCRAYFMEVISSLCFGGVGVPEPELVKLLLDTVFINSDDEVEISTRDLTPYEGKHDSVPVIRSFILQLLLEHRFENCAWFHYCNINCVWFHYCNIIYENVLS